MYYIVLCYTNHIMLCCRPPLLRSKGRAYAAAPTVMSIVIISKLEIICVYIYIYTCIYIYMY